MTRQRTAQGDVTAHRQVVDDGTNRTIRHQAGAIVQHDVTQAHGATEVRLPRRQVSRVVRTRTENHRATVDGQVTVESIAAREVDRAGARKDEASRGTERILDHAGEHEARRGETRSSDGTVCTREFPWRGNRRDVKRVIVNDRDGTRGTADGEITRTGNRDGRTRSQVGWLIERQRRNRVGARAKVEGTSAINSDRGRRAEGPRGGDIRTKDLVHLGQSHVATIHDQVAGDERAAQDTARARTAVTELERTRIDVGRAAISIGIHGAQGRTEAD